MQTIEEAQAFVTKYDKNKNGKLDLDELSEAIAAMSDQKQHFALNPRETELEAVLVDTPRCCVSTLGPPPSWQDLRSCPEV